MRVGVENRRFFAPWSVVRYLDFGRNINKLIREGNYGLHAWLVRHSPVCVSVQRMTTATRTARTRGQTPRGVLPRRSYEPARRPLPARAVPRSRQRAPSLVVQTPGAAREPRLANAALSQSSAKNTIIQLTTSPRGVVQFNSTQIDCDILAA